MKTALPRLRGRRPTPGADVPPATGWGWAAAGALIGLLLVATLAAPARWLAAALSQASRGAVALTDTQGSLWNGSARLVLTGGAGSQDRLSLPGRVQWRLRPALSGATLSLSADCCTPAGPLQLHAAPRWGGARLALADAPSQWPAALLSGLGTPFNTIRPEGELALTTRGLAAEWRDGRARLEGEAELTLRALASRLSTVRPLGSYRVLLRGGEQPSLALSTLDGVLRLSGQGQWIGGLGTRVRFNGEASAAPGHEAQLANLLNLLGRRQGERAILSQG